MKTPVNILKMLRQRRDLDEDDAHLDSELDRMSPMEKLQEVSGWIFGDPNWGTRFIQWAKDCGFKISE